MGYIIYINDMGYYHWILQYSIINGIFMGYDHWIIIGLWDINGTINLGK